MCNQVLIYAYTRLLKDRSTIHAEVLAEYDAKFVFPRVFPAKRDMGTSTHDLEEVTFFSDMRKARKNRRETHVY